MLNSILLLPFVLDIFASIKACETGWIRENDKCYMFSGMTAQSWGEASSICKAFQSKLAEPTTKAQLNFLRSHSQKTGGSFWIGISDIIEEGMWMYSSTRRPILAADWGPGEPLGHTAENCALLYGPTNNKMIDGDCHGHAKFICELDNPVESTIVG